MIFKNM